MAGKVFIDSEKCKGCGLCIAVCPKQSMKISKKSNKHGYFPAEADNSECTGCAACAIICPDAVIEVSRDESTRIVENAKSDKSNKPTMVQEKP